MIKTLTGAILDLDNLRTVDIRSQDIAAGLSKECRFAGQIPKFYCPTPEQRILTADLQWIPAGDIKPATSILAFDEYPHELGMANVPRRRFRHGRITHSQMQRALVYELQLADGTTLTCSSEHPWIVATKQSRNQVWMKTRDIASDIRLGRKRYLPRFMPTWKFDSSYQSGWLAGMFDGEGTFSHKDRRGTQCSIAQKGQYLLHRIRDSLRSLRVAFNEYIHPDNGVTNIQLKGGWRETARLIGTIRPMRLANSFAKALREGEFTKQMDGMRDLVKVESANIVGEQWVVGLETTTHTYLCEGFGAHNSVAEHSIHMARAAPLHLRKWCLLHDASEAYMKDLPRPLKRRYPQYLEDERRLMLVIASRYGLCWPMPNEVKDLDNAMLQTEFQHFRPNDSWTIDIPNVAPLKVRLEFWQPDLAERFFLQELFQCMT